MTSICIKVTANVEANSEMTQRFKNAANRWKGDLFGTVDIKTTKRLSLYWKLQRRHQKVLNSKRKIICSKCLRNIWMEQEVKSMDLMLDLLQPPAPYTYTHAHPNLGESWRSEIHWFVVLISSWSTKDKCENKGLGCFYYQQEIEQVNLSSSSHTSFIL